MASESAISDPNGNKALLLHDPTGAETRKAKAGAAGGQLFESADYDTPRFQQDVQLTKHLLRGVACWLTGYYLANLAASVRYIYVYDASSTGAVTVGSTTPAFVIPLSAAQSANLSKLKIPFTNGIVIAASTSSNGTGAPTANDVWATLFTKDQ